MQVDYKPMTSPVNWRTDFDSQSGKSSSTTVDGSLSRAGSDQKLCNTPADSSSDSRREKISWSDHLWLRCCQCSFWIKYCLFTINFFVWVGGVVLVAIGSWARLERTRFGSFDNLAVDPAVFLIVVGCVMFFISIFGCFGSIRENICLLKCFCIVIAVVFIVEVIAGVLAFVLMDHIQDTLTVYLHAAMIHYQDNHDLHVAIDYIQSKLMCCGAADYNDWELNIYYNCSSPAQDRCGVPSSCCRVPSNVQCGYLTRIEGEQYAAHTIHVHGCIEPLMIIFKDNLIIIGLIAFGVGFVELFAILLAHSLIKEILIARKEFCEKSELRIDLHKVYDSTSPLSQ